MDREFDTGALFAPDRMELHEIIDLVRELGAAGKTVLVSSHILPEVEQVCERVFIIDRGRIVADGTPAEVLTEANLRTYFGVMGRLEGSVFTLHGRVAEDA